MHPIEKLFDTRTLDQKIFDWKFSKEIKEKEEIKHLVRNYAIITASAVGIAYFFPNESLTAINYIRDSIIPYLLKEVYSAR